MCTGSNCQCPWDENGRQWKNPHDDPEPHSHSGHPPSFTDQEQTWVMNQPPERINPTNFHILLGQGRPNTLFIADGNTTNPASHGKHRNGNPCTSVPLLELTGSGSTMQLAIEDVVKSGGHQST